MPAIRPPLPRQRGVIALLLGATLLGMLAVLGLALDLAQLYNRKAELQIMADAAAIAAARELNGTASGIDNAVAAAATAAGKFTYRYNALAVQWSNNAVRFAATPATPDDNWADAAAAQGAPTRMLYAKVDTRQLASDPGLVETVFMRLGGVGGGDAETAARAVAGRASTLVTPLAICAQSATPAAARANVSGNSGYNELVEFGFRRGVAYDLMQLNPHDVTPAHYLIDPLAAPGTTGTAGDFATAVVGPFVCTGQLAMPTVSGDKLTVQRGFPLLDLYRQLNSRFDDYTGKLCLAETAPPDSNIKPFVYTTSWMAPAAATQTAATWISGGKLWTRADPLPGDASNTAPQYGPLWAGARAVPYSAYVAQPVEPASGYSVFATSAWSSLYTPGPPSASGYPTNKSTATPYSQTGGASYFQAPSTPHLPGVANRRVLNVALLACPVAAGAIASASVLGVGRFFMTVPATSSSLSAEFAGVAPAASLSGAVELKR
ncbi:pilus assembly protein TadG-related protein [Duganella lactea]|uniref:pilus assembly protein TadG-related protein n=1 Tax=Duganella lactea TaxID=2692173 RepID=UPI0035306835